MPPLPITVSTPLGAGFFVPAELNVREAVSELFHVQLELTAANGKEVAFDKLLGEKITILRKGYCEFAVADGLSVPIAIGDPLTTNNSGKFVKATTTGHMVVARAEQACSTDDTQIEIELIDAYPLP